MNDLNINQIIYLGDSLTDNGNFSNLTGGSFPNNPFYAPGYFSNGMVWSKLLADELGLDIVPATTPNPQNYEGINFALGGATSGSKNIGLPVPAGLKQQVDSLTGLKGSPAINPDALYSVWAGANDYFAVNLSADKIKKEVKAIVQETIGNLKTTLTTLVKDMDAQDIMVFNLPDLSQTPLARTFQPDARKTLQSLSFEHNKQLNKEMKSLSKTFSDVNFIYMDIGSEITKIKKNPNSFGFSNVTEAATNTDIYNPAFQLDPNNFVVRDNPDNYFYWDSVHPTHKAHQFIADYVLDVLKSDDDLAKPNKALVVTIEAQNLLNSELTVTSNNLLSVASSSVISNPSLPVNETVGQLESISSQKESVSNNLLEEPVNELFMNQLTIPVFQVI